MDWEQLEALYWQFDARHKGYGKWLGMPTSERDAFKHTVKQALAEKDKAYQQLLEQAVRFAREWANPTGYPSQVEAYAFMQSPEAQAFLKEREQ